MYPSDNGHQAHRKTINELLNCFKSLTPTCLSTLYEYDAVPEEKQVYLHWKETWSILGEATDGTKHYRDIAD